MQPFLKKRTKKKFSSEYERHQQGAVSIFRSDTIQPVTITACVGSWTPLINPFLEALGVTIAAKAETALILGPYSRDEITSLREGGVSVRFVTLQDDPWLAIFLPPEARVPYQSVSHILEGALLLLGQDDLAAQVREARGRIDPRKGEEDVEALMKLTRLRHPALRVPYGTVEQFEPLLCLLKTKNPFIVLKEDGRVGESNDFPEEGLYNRIFMTSWLWEKYAFVEPYFGDFTPVEA